MKNYPILPSQYYVGSRIAQTIYAAALIDPDSAVRLMQSLGLKRSVSFRTIREALDQNYTSDGVMIIEEAL